MRPGVLEPCWAALPTRVGDLELREAAPRSLFSSSSALVKHFRDKTLKPHARPLARIARFYLKTFAASQARWVEPTDKVRTPRITSPQTVVECLLTSGHRRKGQASQGSQKGEQGARRRRFGLPREEKGRYVYFGTPRLFLSPSRQP